MTIMTRSALVYWGHNPAPDVALVLIDDRGRHVVTWADVMRMRRERQQEQLRRKRCVVEWRAYKLWVAYFDQPLMGGWQALLEDWRGRPYSEWIDRDRSWLRPMLMKLFPLVPDVGTENTQWGEWKPAFAEQFERRRQDGRPLGVACLWWDQYDAPRRAQVENIKLE